MNKELFFLGQPATFKEGILVYPPRVKDVVTNPLFWTFTQILTYSQEEIEDDFMKEKKEVDVYPTPLELLFNNSYHNKKYEEYAKQAFEFFTKQEVSFLYDVKKIVFGNLGEKLKTINSINELVMLGEEDFFDFQNLVRCAIGKKMVDAPDLKEHPKVKEMKRKARYRDRVKAKQAKKDGLTLEACLTSICCMGIGITPLNIGEMSYVAMNNIFSKFQEKEKYELDIDTLLAGGDSKKINPKYWIRNFEE